MTILFLLLFFSSSWGGVSAEGRLSIQPIKKFGVTDLTQVNVIFNKTGINQEKFSLLICDDKLPYPFKPNNNDTTKEREEETNLGEALEGQTGTRKRENGQVLLSEAWLNHKFLVQRKRELIDLYSTLRSIEVSFEAVPQMFIISTIMAVTYLLPNTSHLGLLEENTVETYLQLGWSLLLSYGSVISGYLNSMNMKKDSQLDFTKKATLGLALSLQLLGRLLPLINIALSALPQTDLDSPKLNPALTLETTALLLLTPIFLHWIVLLFFYNTCEVPVFHQLPWFQKMIHILGNTWVSFPAQSLKQVDQHFKAKEHITLLVLSGLNIAATCAAATLLMEDRTPRFWLGLPTQQEFVLFIGFPSILSHFLGCLVLLLYYNQCHTFRALGETRQKKCCSSLFCTCLCITCDPEEALTVERGNWEL